RSANRARRRRAQDGGNVRFNASPRQFAGIRPGNRRIGSAHQSQRQADRPIFGLALRLPHIFAFSSPTSCLTVGGGVLRKFSSSAFCSPFPLGKGVRGIGRRGCFSDFPFPSGEGARG